MAKVNFKFNPKGLEQRVRQAFLEVKSDSGLLTKIGELFVKQIVGQGKKRTPYNRTRSFPDLKSTTVVTRKTLRKKSSPKDRPFDESKSNLLLTGQLWRSVKFEIMDKRLEIFVDDNRRTEYVLPSGKKVPLSPKAKTNKDLSELLAGGISNGKKFVMFVGSVVGNDAKLVKRVTALTQSALRKELVKKFGKSIK